MLINKLVKKQEQYNIFGYGQNNKFGTELTLKNYVTFLNDQ